LTWWADCVTATFAPLRLPIIPHSIVFKTASVVESEVALLMSDTRFSANSTDRLMESGPALVAIQGIMSKTMSFTSVTGGIVSCKR